jgi:AraC-like DNA-binding protein
MARLMSWDLKSFARLQYKVSETHPLVVARKLHPSASPLSFDMHYALELGVVLSGRMARSYEGHRRTVLPGQVWLCGAWEPHAWQVLSGPCSAVVVTIFPPMLASASHPEAPSFDWMAPFTSPPAARPQVPPEVQPEVLRLGRRLAATAEGEMPAGPRRTLLQRMLLFELLLALPEVQPAAPRTALPADAYSRINKAVELVFKSRRFLTGAEAARACALGRKSFTDLFEQMMGVSFPRFALHHRLHSAASQLLQSDDPLKVVAADWGFTDASHLHTCFRAAYGCSPAEYRRRNTTLEGSMYKAPRSRRSGVRPRVRKMGAP